MLMIKVLFFIYISLLNRFLQFNFSNPLFRTQSIMFDSYLLKTDDKDRKYSAKKKKRKVVQLKNANISQKIYRDIVHMDIFLKLIQFTIF